MLSVRNFYYTLLTYNTKNTYFGNMIYKTLLHYRIIRSNSFICLSYTRFWKPSFGH